ncbi:BLUF domain-containing protein [Rhodoferax sp. PAMC 29310]|uniref:BLUF domain-containing protein n=1 Tax=Rhodoferax sp. PAMC 29310 TaxID=2822760 RepID=UPI001B320C92|nr:BLUF domain-containing protein [Rhodoferax sp. PAMC 29310]
MYYMIYVSQAKKPMNTAELDQLLSQSRKWNTAMGLTGLLIYRYSTDSDTGHFIQMLEGDESEVRSLFDKIKRDKRHHTVLTFGSGEIESRMFSEWSMGFKNVDDALFSELPGYARIGEASFDPAAFQQSNTAALDLLKFFHDAH